MNIIDIILLLCFIPAIIDGIRKGFIAQVIALISLILGAWLSYRFGTAVGGWMAQRIETSEQLLNVIAFVVIFIIVAAVLFLVGKLIEKTIKLIMLGWLNRLLGVVFSLLKCILIVGMLLIVFDALNTLFKMVSEEYVTASVLHGPLTKAVYSIFPYFKGFLTIF